MRSSPISGDGAEPVLPLLDALSDAYVERDRLQERIDRLLNELYAQVRTAERVAAASSVGHPSHRVPNVVVGESGSAG